MSIPYAWFVANPTTDTISISYTASIDAAFTVGSATKLVSVRSSTYGAPPAVGVPAINSTTTKTFAVRL